MTFGDASPGSITPDDATKNDFTNRVGDLSYRLPKTPCFGKSEPCNLEEGILGQAIQIKKDIIQYIPWESSWIGGYRSRNELLEKVREIDSKLSPKYARSRGITIERQKEAFSPISANCKDLARDSTAALFVPASLLEFYFCHPTAVKIGAGSVCILILLGILGPYINLFSKIYTGRINSPRFKKKK